MHHLTYDPGVCWRLWSRYDPATGRGHCDLISRETAVSILTEDTVTTIEARYETFSQALSIKPVGGTCALTSA